VLKKILNLEKISGSSTVSSSDNGQFGTNAFSGLSISCVGTTTVKIVNGSAVTITYAGLNAVTGGASTANYLNSDMYLYVVASPDTNSRLISYKATYEYDLTTVLAPSLPDDYNTSMPPYRFATTSCETIGSSSLCTMAYKPEFYYLEIMFVLGIFFFIWLVFKK